MNKHQFVAVLIGLLLGWNAHAATGDTLRITNGEWAPFTSTNLPHGGVLSRIVTEAFALEGVKVEYGYFPWKRAYGMARDGIWDGSIGWAPTPDHRQDFHMSEPVIVVDKALFHLKTTPFDWSTIEDLRKWQVGMTAGYSYGPEWDQAIKEGRLDASPVTYDEQNVRRLIAGRIQVFAMETAVAEYLFRTILTPEQAASITAHPKLLVRTPICLAISRRRADGERWVETFNRGLQQLKDAGLYDRYLEEASRLLDDD